MSINLSISLVTHYSDIEHVKSTLIHLIESCKYIFEKGKLSSADIYLVDNSVDINYFTQLNSIVQYLNNKFKYPVNIYCHQLGKNIGYGMGHNSVIDTINSTYHLVINPDVDVQKDSLLLCVDYIKKNKDVGMITPFTVNESGEQLHLNKRYPSILILFIRGFFPFLLSNNFKKLSYHYEMRDIALENVDSIKLSSGCFMFFKTQDLKRIGGFSYKFFLYFEDFDLTYRFSAMKKIAFVPQVKATHYGGYSASKGIKHIFLFVRSSITFFNRFGWRLY